MLTTFGLKSLFLTRMRISSPANKGIKHIALFFFYSSNSTGTGKYKNEKPDGQALEHSVAPTPLPNALTNTQVRATSDKPQSPYGPGNGSLVSSGGVIWIRSPGTDELPVGYKPWTSHP